MKARKSFKTLGTVAALAAVVLVGILGSSLRLQAQNNNDPALVQQGYAIAPVPMNLAGRDYNLVGIAATL
jgi:hypothetical protein